MDKELQELLAQFNATQTEIRNTLSAQAGEIKATGESSAATATKLAGLTAQIQEQGLALQAAAKRVETLETEIAAGRFGGGPEAPKSAGQQFVESDAYRSMVQANVERSERVLVGSFFPRNTLVTSTNAGAAVEPQRVAGIVAPMQRGLRLRDIMRVAPTGSNLIQYVEETGFTNAAAMQVEGAAKAESALSFELKDTAVKTLAHWLPATRQILSDAPQLQEYTDTRLIYGLKIVEESQILYGNGVGQNLLGIAVHPDVQTYAWSDGEVGDTKIDAIRRAITLARIAEYPVDGIALHPTDWADIELAKGDDGHYLWVNIVIGGQMQLWRVPVVETTAVNAGSSVLGAFGLAATLWDREEASVRVSDSHSTFFTENKVAILAEERLALSIYRPEGFVAVDFDAAPVAP